VQAAIESNGKNPEGAPPGESRVLMTLNVPYSVTPAGLAYGKAVLNRLKALIDASGVNLEYATMGDVERRFMRVVELPVIKQKVNVTNASWVLQLVLLAPLSLLLVLVESLWMIVREKPQKEIESLDLIFFYPSISAYVLGILWLIAPVLLITIGMRHFFTEAHTTLQNWIAAMAAAAILATIGIVWKRVHQIRRKTYDVAPESATATEQEEEEDEDDDAI